LLERSSSVLSLLVLDLPDSFILHLSAQFCELLNDVRKAIADEVRQVRRVRVNQGREAEDHAAEFEVVGKRGEVDEQAVEHWEGPPVLLQDIESQSRVVP